LIDAVICATVTLAVAVLPADASVMFAVPLPAAVTRPDGLTVATAGLLLLQLKN
jgi:hypothetical protein